MRLDFEMWIFLITMVVSYVYFRYKYHTRQYTRPQEVVTVEDHDTTTLQVPFYNYRIEPRTTPPVPEIAPQPFVMMRVQRTEQLMDRLHTSTKPASDSQNVHDSTVVKTVKASLSRLPSNPRMGLSESLTRARLICKDRHAALETLDKMERNTTPLMALGLTESEVLQRVISAIDDNDSDKETMLALELEECHKAASCASGRVARVVGSLCALDDRVKIMPTWALKQEMLAKAATLHTHDPEAIKKALHDEYVTPGLATIEFVDAEVASWRL